MPNLGICASLPTPNKLSPFIACITKSCDSSSPGQALSVIVSNCELSKSPLAPSIISQAIRAVPTSGITQQTILLATTTTPTRSMTVTHLPSTVEPVVTGAAATTKKGNGDGTLLNLEGGGIKKERGCLLGLTVGVLAGVAWFWTPAHSLAVRCSPIFTCWTNSMHNFHFLHVALSLHIQTQLAGYYADWTTIYGAFTVLHVPSLFLHDTSFLWRFGAF